MPLYLYLMIFTVLDPLIRSFEPRIHYYRRWHALFLAIIVIGIPFIIWDVYFTDQGYWGFNPD